MHKITIIPRTSGALGYTLQIDEGDRVLMNREQILAMISTYMGGRAAEELVFNTVTTGAANDIEKATRLARDMVTRFGISEEFGMMALETMNNQYLGGDTSPCSSETAARIDTVVERILKSSYQQACNILEENMDKLHELAEYYWRKKPSLERNL